MLFEELQRGGWRGEGGRKGGREGGREDEYVKVNNMRVRVIT